MTFRATVRDGLIVINTHGALPDGATVQVVDVVSPKKSRSIKSKVKKAAPKSSKRRRTPDFGFGGWRHRSDIQDTAEFARELRQSMFRRPSRG